ncbi:MAG: extracellular solute-binding protein, partial [Staphylothermus sp.]|nr:extracellular solute-binding protein [Staphylothermus sp.]
FGSPVDTTRVINVERAAKIVTALLEKYGVDVKVTVDTEKSQYFRGGYWTQLEQAFVAEQAPDIFAMKELGKVVEAGYALQLDEYVEKYWALVADIYKVLWHAVTYKGHIWAIPQDTEVRPLYFRKDVLRELGWSEEEINALPEKILTGEITIEDLIQVAKEAMEKGLVDWGFYHRKGFGGTPFIILYYQYGGILQDPETGKLVLDKQAMLKTLQLLCRMAQVDKVLPPTMIATDWRIIHTDFVNGRVLFFFGGSWHWAEWQRVPYHEELGNLTEEYEWQNIGFALVPAPESGLEPMTLSSPVLYYVSSQTKFPETSFILVALATSAPLDARHAVDSAHLPIRITTQFDQYYQQSKFHKEAVYMLQYTSFEPVHEKWEVYKNLWENAIAKVEGGEATPEQVLNEMIAALQAEIGDEIIIK